MAIAVKRRPSFHRHDGPARSEESSRRRTVVWSAVRRNLGRLYDQICFPVGRLDCVSERSRYYGRLPASLGSPTGNRQWNIFGVSAQTTIKSGTHRSINDSEALLISLAGDDWIRTKAAPSKSRFLTSNANRRASVNRRGGELFSPQSSSTIFCSSKNIFGCSFLFQNGM